MRAIEQYTCPTCGRPTAAPSQEISAGRLRIEPLRGIVELDGQRVYLTGAEYAVVEQLAQNPDRIHPKWSLVTAIGGRGETDKMADVMVCKVRRKFRAITEDEIIRTVWGEGYTLAQKVTG